MSAVLERARETLNIEIQGLQTLAERLDARLEEAVDLMFQCQGKVIVTGMGKSGLIGRKIAATLTSTGTPSIFLHPAESFHGDLGIIGASDVVLALSYSGETVEVLQIVGHLQTIGIPLIAITGKRQSSLAHHANVHLELHIEKEACPLGLAPTTSTTVTLALGDALAMCLLEKRRFRAEDFAVFHPGGSLGKKLTITVGDLMLQGEALPRVPVNISMREALHCLAEKKIGIVIAQTDEGKLAGVFSVGDLMRLTTQQKLVLEAPLSQFMSLSPKVIEAHQLAARALHLMETYSITCLVVVDPEHKPLGALQIYDILRAGIY